MRILVELIIGFFVLSGVVAWVFVLAGFIGKPPKDEEDPPRS